VKPSVLLAASQDQGCTSGDRHESDDPQAENLRTGSGQ
jgi:hypothetical protein